MGNMHESALQSNLASVSEPKGHGMVCPFLKSIPGRFFAALLCATAHSLSVWAEPEAPVTNALQQLSLEQAQRLAFERNWDLLAAAKGIDVATAQKIVAHEFPNPTLSLSTLKVNVDNHPASTDEGNGFWDRNYDTIFAINQLFEIGGKRRSRRQSAQAGYEGARALFFDARRTLDLAMTKAY